MSINLRKRGKSSESIVCMGKIAAAVLLKCLSSMVMQDATPLTPPRP